MDPQQIGYLFDLEQSAGLAIPALEFLEALVAIFSGHLCLPLDFPIYLVSVGLTQT